LENKKKKPFSKELVRAITFFLLCGQRFQQKAKLLGKKQ